MKTILYVGAFDAAEIIAIHSNFDVCYVVDTNGPKSEYIARLFKNDPNVHVIHITPSALCDSFCERNAIGEVDTLVISRGDEDRAFLTTLGDALVKERSPSVVGIKAPLPDETAEESQVLLAHGYRPCAERSQIPGYARRDAIRAQWWRRPGEIQNNEQSGGINSHFAGKQYSFNCVYSYLHDENSTISRRGNAKVLVSSTPQPGYDLYFYHDAFSFRGKQAGYDTLLVAEPFTILPGEYNRDIWDLFDHAFSFCDAPIERDSKFTKVISWMGDWSAETVITEDVRERERKYPIEGRQRSICMINGNKCSWVRGELYSERAEAALWFSANSDIFFDVYGRPAFLLPNYKGAVPDDKRLVLLAQYRYNWCFENIDHPIFGSGYVAEKILDCLETRTVPIYLGNGEIEKYVPKECFIDFRDFGSYEAVNEYLHVIGEDEYMTYIENIDKFVSNGGLRPYSWQTLYDQIARWYCSQEGIELGRLFGDQTMWKREPASLKTSVVSSALWSFDDLRFRPSQFMVKEDFLTTKPWETLPADVDARVRRSVELASQGKYRDALMEISLSGFSAKAEHHFVAAELMQLNGLSEAAFVQVSLALLLDPGHSYAHNLLGALHFQKGEIMKAEEEFRKAVESDSDNHLARKNLAFLLLNTGRKDEGIPLARAVESYFPDEVRAWGV
jgi:tetratricopeptide (TPR) repeat protein